jgi:parallel beta-helix repeat protein
VSIGSGVTLTIEPGVTVNLNSYDIQVDGTLTARGSYTDKIIFNGGNIDPNKAAITFMPGSTNWNEQTSSGCIVENANLLNARAIHISDVIGSHHETVYNTSPKINNNSIYDIDITGSPIISNNTITHKISITVGQPKILHNNITNTNFGSFYVMGGAPEISHNTIAGGIEERFYWYPPVDHLISYNSIAGGGIDIDHYGGSVTMLNNNVSGSGFGTAIKVIGIPSIIAGNTIIGKNDIGIYVPNMDSTISGNTISGCTTGILSGKKATIERNAIFNNTESGIKIQAGTCTIRNNAIVNNSIGIYLNSSSSTIIYNNIQDNKQNSIYLSNGSSDVKAILNWWGTTDTQAINQTIYDSKNDFNLGTVNFVPFLTKPNTEAPTLSAPTLTPSPSIPKFSSWIILPLLIIVVISIGLLIYFRKRKR